MLWGITLWALGHLLSNGDLVSLVLFGSFLVFALIDMLSANRRGAEKARIKASFTNDLATVIIGVLAYLALAWAHPYFTGLRLCISPDESSTLLLSESPGRKRHIIQAITDIFEMSGNHMDDGLLNL